MNSKYLAIVIETVKEVGEFESNEALINATAQN